MKHDKKKEEAIFKAAIEIDSPRERAAFVKSECGEDAELLRRVEGLLKFHYEDDRFLTSPPACEAVTLDNAPLSEGPGTKIGRYKLLQRIGEGGFGVVYMAEQERPIRRRVALKIIKLGMDTKQVIARFEAERQALAMMEHPNIAKVLDGGATETGRPYFVMELVKGMPITEYCDQNNLDTQERLELFVDVCKAVQHAHQKGIIHRDIKPSNVMITLHDGKPVPKVIDFGIAKATQQRLTEKTLFTEYQQFIGTPEYMSPEQAEMSGLDIDTRSDIYSLGVLLYELLTGTTPFEGEKLRSAAYDEIRRIIRENEPPKPSTRLSTLGETLADIAKHRHVQPGELRQIVRGDLDWIVMKSLEKDRTRRYETANDLAQDIHRHLQNEPVLASPPSRTYRLRKFVRRNRAGLIAGSMVAAALLVGTLVSTIGFVQARRQRDLARTNLQTSEIQRRRAEDNFSMSLNAVDEMLKVAKLSLDEHLAFKVAQKPQVSNPELEEMRQAILQKAQLLYEEFLKKNSTDPAARMETARAYYRTAHIHQELGQYDQAVPAYRNAINTYERLDQEWSSEPGLREDLSNIRRKLAIYYYDLCWALKEAKRVDEAEQLFWQAMRLFDKLAVDFTNVDKEWERFNDVSSILTNLRMESGQLEAAEKLARKGNKITEQFAEHYPTFPRYRGDLMHTLDGTARVIERSGKSQEAERFFRKADELNMTFLEEESNDPAFRMEKARAYFRVGRAHKQAGRRDEALQAFRNAINTFEKLNDEFSDKSEPGVDLGHIRRHLAMYYHTLCHTLKEAERVDEAEEVYWRAMTLFGELAANFTNVCFEWADFANLANAVGIMRLNAGQLEAAERILRRGNELARLFAEHYPNSASYVTNQINTLCVLGHALSTADKSDEAEQIWQKCLTVCEKGIDLDPNISSNWLGRGASYLGLSQFDKAIAACTKAIELDSNNGHYLHMRGSAYRGLKQFDKVVADYTKAIELDPNVSHYWAIRGSSRFELNDFDKAVADYTKAIELDPDNDNFRRLRDEAAERVGNSEQSNGR